MNRRQPLNPFFAESAVPNRLRQTRDKHVVHRSLDLVELVEVPRLEEVDFFPAPERNKVSARDRALQVALNAERGAQKYYASLVEKAEPGPLRQLYCELAEMEDGHVASIEKRISAHPAKNTGK